MGKTEASTSDTDISPYGSEATRPGIDPCHRPSHLDCTCEVTGGCTNLFPWARLRPLQLILILEVVLVNTLPSGHLVEIAGGGTCTETFSTGIWGKVQD